jgi:hypothetical protein
MLLLLLMVPLTLADAGLLMLGVGVLHHEWWAVVPTMSYETALTLSSLASAAVVCSLVVAGAVS